MKKILILIIASSGFFWSFNVSKKPYQMMSKGLHFALPKAFASGGSDNVYTKVEIDLFEIIGFPSTAVYNALTGGDGPPQEGLLGLLASAGSVAKAAIIAAGHECSTIPSTGSLVATGTVHGVSTPVSVTFASPSHIIPDGHTHAGTAYTKRIEMSFTMSSEPVALAVEMICGDNSDQAFASLSIAGGTLPHTTRSLQLYIDSNNNLQITDFGMVVVGDSAGSYGGKVYDAQLSHLVINKTTGEYWIDGVDTYNRPNNNDVTQADSYGGYRFGAHGNETNVSIYFDYDKTFGTTAPSVSTAAAATYSSPAGTLYSLTDAVDTESVHRTYNGCAQFSSQVNLANATLCSGLALADPGVPNFGSGGTFSMGWVHDSLKSAMGI